MRVKLLTEHHLESLSLKGGCTGSPVSTLVKITHCWKSHATAHIYFIDTFAKTLETGILLNVKLLTVEVM